MQVKNISAAPKSANIFSFKTNGAKTTTTPDNIVHSNNSLQTQNVTYPLNPQIPANYTKIGVQKTPLGEDIHLYKLSNGQRVAIVPHEGSTIVKTSIAAGSLNETDNLRGISHFIEHNLFNGSKNLAPGDVFKRTTEMGADTNASTDFAVTDYYISSSVMDDKELQKAIEIQADMILNPNFSPDMIEKEKGPVTSEISMINDDIAGTVAQDVIKNLFQMTTKSQNLVGGSIETVNALTRDDLVNHHGKYYTPDNMYTVVVGDVNPEKTMQIIAQNFNQKPKENPEQGRYYEKLTPITSPKRIDVISPLDNSSNIMAGFAVPKFQTEKECAQMGALALLLTGYKNARLTKNLRVLDSYADVSDPEIISPDKNAPRACFIYIGSPPSQTQKALDCMYKTIEDIKTNPPTADEMAIIKNSMLKSISMVYEDPIAICSVVGSALMQDRIGEINKQKEAINALTPQDIVQTAQTYLDLNKVSLGIVHAKNTTEAQIKNNYFASPYAQKTSTAAAVSFGANKPLTTESVKQYKLADNTLAVLNSSNSDICYMNWKLTSYPSTPKNLAVPYVLTEILNNGSAFRDKDKYSRDANVKGIRYGFDSNGFAITVDANCLYPNIQEALGMLKETIFSPRFDEYEFEVAKQKIASYCSTLNKDASEALIAQLYPEYFASSQQILEGLKNVTLKDVQKHWNDMVRNSSSNFVVSAPFNKVEGLQENVLAGMLNQKAKFQDHTPTLAQIYNPTRQAKVMVSTEERNQAQVYKAYSFNMSGNIKDEVKFEILNTILGASPSSRLFCDLREKQKLAYSVGSQIQSFGDTGILTFHTSTTTDDKKQNDIKYDNLQKVLDGFKKHSDLLQTEPPSAQELEDAKRILKQNIHSDMELPSSETYMLAINAVQPYGIKRIDEYYKAIDEITPEDIMIAAKHIFKNQPVTSVLASEDTVNSQIGYLQTLGHVEAA